MNIMEKDWDLIIKPRGNNFSLNLKEVWRYRDLLQMYIHRDIITVYKQTILGPLWFLIQPIFTTILFMFLFGKVANIPTDGIPQPLFYMAGMLCWNYFSDCLNKASSTFSNNAGVFSKVYFPRLVVPISNVISNLIKMLIQFLLFAGLYIYFMATGMVVEINAYILLLPILILMLAGLGFGFGVIISSLTIKYRDLTILIGFAIGLMIYLTPVAYPLSVLAERYPQWMWIIEANPLTPITECFRYGFFGAGTFSWLSLCYSLLFTIGIMLVGTWTFNKVERSFVDVV